MLATRWPVVVLVLDELPVQSLMNAEGNIDDSRFPGFASLLDDFTWFRNTATMHHRTAKDVADVVTGRPRVDDSSRQRGVIRTICSQSWQTATTSGRTKW